MGVDRATLAGEPGHASAGPSELERAHEGEFHDPVADELEAGIDEQIHAARKSHARPGGSRAWLSAPSERGSRRPAGRSTARAPSSPNPAPSAANRVGTSTGAVRNPGGAHRRPTRTF